ncbi:unnamed protein product [Caenorhabditis angaria]|uniref:CX domain-containing protein n=1 Tax=Caenorhabditis angaria TaxID=860376 RepID=A0A9P1N9G9_9PELO|nr:unnamed protein product [Caenorhabditis angaria]
MVGLGLWSRWDSPGEESTKNLTTLRTFEKIMADSVEVPRLIYLDKRINTIDASFYDCIYSITNSADTIIERCYKDIGCCASGCCTNRDWQVKYGWAVALISLFSLVVIFTVICWMSIWLCNRKKDKTQKRELMKYGSSSAISTVGGLDWIPGSSFAYPISNGHYHFGTGPFQSPPLNYPTKY